MHRREKAQGILRGVQKNIKQLKSRKGVTQHLLYLILAEEVPAAVERRQVEVPQSWSQLRKIGSDQERDTG